MRRVATWVTVAVFSLLPISASAWDPIHELIVPNTSIGPFRLGMTAAAIQALKKSAPCQITAAYRDGKAVRLETNCGGAYHTPEWVQVGIGSGKILWFYGTPDNVTRSDGFNYRADWLYYRGGISFRVVYGDGATNTLIQSIAVFPGTGRLQVRQEPFPGTAPAPPGVGE
ncbi:MAG TPA: hypothetical protein VGK88_05715 [bacterium]|jgi:hypothetical protein